MLEIIKKPLRIIRTYLRYPLLKLEMKNERKTIKIVSSSISIDYLINSTYSLCRFGDGELMIINGESLGFQKWDLVLANRLKEILCSNPQNCYIGVLDTINSLNNLIWSEKVYWINNMYLHRKEWIKYLNENQLYLSSSLTRVYHRYKNKKNCKFDFEKLKKIWKDRDIVCIEGKGTRLGIGNDLFDNAKSIRRIICPEKDSFSIYKKIISEAKLIDRNVLIIISLGPTATVLAYDLSQLGYHALDLGHFDIEYEWYILGAKKKINIKNKSVNEVDINYGECTNRLYMKQIIKVIDSN